MSPLLGIGLAALLFVAFAWLGRNLDAPAGGGCGGCADADGCAGCHAACPEPEVKDATDR